MLKFRSFAHGGLLVESFYPHLDVSQNPLLTLPPQALMPLAQYSEAKAKWLVKVGDVVKEQQPIAVGISENDAILHAPIPGVIESFKEMALPDGTKTSGAVIRLEGSLTRSSTATDALNLDSFSREELWSRLRQSGIPFISSTLDPVWLLTSTIPQIDELVFSAVPSEPYLTISIHHVIHQTEWVIRGIQILCKIFQPKKSFFVWTSGLDPILIQHLRKALPLVKFQIFQEKYPQAQKSLIRQALGLKSETKVLDIETLVAVYEALVLDRKYIEKSVIVSGPGIVNPGVYRVRLGTPVSSLLQEAGGLKSGFTTVIHGGPFLGSVLRDLNVPIIKTTQSILVLGPKDLHVSKTQDCIRCGSCINVCPAKISPMNLLKALVQNDELAVKDGLKSCIGCALCSYICPSRLPLFESFQSRLGENCD